MKKTLLLFFCIFFFFSLDGSEELSKYRHPFPPYDSIPQVRDTSGHETIICGVLPQQALALEQSGIEARYRRDISRHLPVEARPATVLTIPVVIYLIHPRGSSPGTGAVPSIAEIKNGLQLINQVWNGGASCHLDFSIHKPRIQFCLAQRDIRGIATTGIEVITSDTYAFLDQCREEKGLKMLPRRQSDRFPTTDYLNIYLVKEICASCSPYDCDIGGFASYSAVHGTTQDGIVVEYKAFPGISNNCSLAVTFHHELGHYFNLLHTFHGGCKNTDCLADGDKVCDTPPDSYTSIYADNPCISGRSINSCHSDADANNPENPFSTDVPDLSNNIMDYAPPVCQSSFTAGQVQRMRWTLQHTRSSLLQSKGCLPPCVPAISLSIEDAPKVVEYGEPFTIINTGSTAYPMQWIVAGQVIPSRDLHYTPTKVGYLQIALTSPAMQAGCHDTLHLSIKVVCGFTGTIQGPRGMVSLGQDLQWVVNNPTPGSTIRWYLNDSLITTGTTFRWTVNRKGQSSLSIVLCKNGCCETVDRAWISTENCPTGKEGIHWIFGDLDPVHLIFQYDTIENPDITTDFFGYEAVVTQSDRYGHLLFYSDGNTVFNRNHEVMKFSNGEIRLDDGNISTTQMVSVPWPGRDSMYFLFYSSDQNRDYTYLRAALIDMQKNGGLGEVISDTIKLFAPSTEKINAVRHCNGRDWWVISTRAGTDELLAFLVDTGGIHRDPVISTMLVKQKFGLGKTGELVISPSGKYIFIINPLWDRVSPSGFFQTLPEFGTFNCHTGKYSPIDSILLDKVSGYAATFSPEEKYIYFTSLLAKNGVFQLPVEHILRWKKIKRGTINKYDNIVETGGMELGPDGAIYFIRATHGDGLGSIEFPDRPGQAAQVIPYPDRLPLDFGGITLNLPTFPAGIYHPGRPFIRGPRMYCDTASDITFTAGPLCIPLDYSWKVHGKSRILYASQDSLVLAPAYQTDTIIYTRTTGCATLSDTMIIRPAHCLNTCELTFQWITQDTVICPGADVFLRYSSNAVFSHIYPSHAGMPALTVRAGNITGPAPRDSALTYYLHLEMQLGCDTLIPITLTPADPLTLENFTVDTLRCAGDSLHISYTTSAAYRYLINQQTGSIRSLPLSGVSLPPFPGDSCYTLLFYSADSACLIDTSFCTRIGSLVSTSTDSLSICAGDSILWRQMWLDSAGLYRDTVNCDTIFSLQLSVLPFIPPTFLTDTTCLYDSIHIDTAILQSEYACDSLLITTYIPAPLTVIHDTTTTCDSSFLGIDTTLFSHPQACDTLLITRTLYAETLTTVLTRDTCSISPVPDDTLHLISTHNCDSLVIIHYKVSIPDTILIDSLVCSAQQDEIHHYTGQDGCDSVVIIHYNVSMPDTTLIDSLVCSARQDEIHHYIGQDGCDSVVIIHYRTNGHFLSLPPVIEASQGDTITFAMQRNFIPDTAFWNTIEGMISDPLADSITIIARETILYEVTFIDSLGCVYRAAVQVVVHKPDRAVYIPTAFSPNHDGINDVFRPFFGKVKPESYQLSIYDRWGSRIYSCAGTSCAWTGMHRGRPVTPGVYTYSILLHYKKKTVRYKGDVTVLK